MKLNNFLFFDVLAGDDAPTQPYTMSVYINAHLYRENA